MNKSDLDELRAVLALPVDIDTAWIVAEELAKVCRELLDELDAADVKMALWWPGVRSCISCESLTCSVCEMQIYSKRNDCPMWRGGICRL